MAAHAPPVLLAALGGLYASLLIARAAGLG